MNDFKLWLLNEGGKFRKSKSIVHVVDYPMFSVFMDEKLDESYFIAFDKLKKKIASAFATAKNKLNKMGFPSMHANVVFEKTSSLTLGVAHGNPKAEKYNKPLRYITLAVKYLHHLEDEKVYESMIQTITHEWAHLWMFNNTKSFKEAVQKYHDALIHSNIDKVPYEYYTGDPDVLWKNFLTSIKKSFPQFNKLREDFNKGNYNIHFILAKVKKLVSHFLYSFGPTHLLVDDVDIEKTVNKISLIIFNTLVENANLNNALEEIDKLDYGNLFAKKIRESIQSRMVKNLSVRKELSRLINWINEYGLRDPDETWAEGITWFLELHPYHRRRIMELMNIR